MALYSDLEGYKQLNESEKLIFRHLYEKLIFVDVITLSDRQLADFFLLTLSQWEKLLRKFCENKLLERNNIKSRENGKWKTIARQIRLDPKTFAFTSLSDYMQKHKKAMEMLELLGGSNGIIDDRIKDN